MRKVAVHALQDPAKSVLLSLNRFFYILKPLDATSSLTENTSESVQIGYKIQSKVERDATQHFEVFEDNDWLISTDESNKFINFYSLSEVLQANASEFPTAKHQLRSNKKVTEIKRVSFGPVQGLLIADKMGEIGFVNMQNVPRLPTPEAIIEEQKEMNLPEGELPPFEDIGVYKTLYGHQETCLGIEMSNDRRLIASCDTLKKINVVNWPNVFNMQSVLLEHSLPIHYMCFVGLETVASVSEPAPVSKKQDLILSAASDARVINQLKVDGVKALAQTRRGTLALLQENNEIKEIALAEGAEPEAVSLLTEEQASTYRSAYFSRTGVNLPSVLLLANFSDATGALETREEADSADLVIKTL